MISFWLTNSLQYSTYLIKIFLVNDDGTLWTFDFDTLNTMTPRPFINYPAIEGGEYIKKPEENVIMQFYHRAADDSFGYIPYEFKQVI